MPEEFDDYYAQLTQDDLWAMSWLDRTYGGAPDECSFCFRQGTIIKFADCKIHNV